MVILFGSGQSRSFRVLWALEESGLEYEYKHVTIGSPKHGGSQSEEYKQLNIQGKVPSLQHGNLVINECSAIMNYIAALTPNQKLVPTDPELRAYYDEICSFVISDLEQPLWTNAKHRFVLPKHLRIKKVLDTTHWEFNKSLQALEHYLDNQQFVIDDQFTMADILISHTLHWANSAKFKISQHLLDYTSRMYLRPACKRAIEVIS